MGKEEIDNFFCLIGDIWNFFLQKCLLSSPLRFIRLFVQIGEFDWLSARRHGVIKKVIVINCNLITFS